MTVTYQETDLLLESGDSEQGDTAPSLSRFCEQKLKQIRFKLVCLGGTYFLGALIIYPFFYKALSLFPESQAFSLLQAIVIITGIPAAACFSLYKARLKDQLDKIHHWNEVDEKRCSELSRFLTSIHDQEQTAPPCTEGIISGREEDGEWTVHGVDFGPVPQDLTLLLRGMTLSHSRNYAGLGFGTITGRQPEEEEEPQKIHPREAHNIEGVLTLGNNQGEKKVFLPGPKANLQWLTQMQLGLTGSPLAPEGSHTHKFITALPFKDILKPDQGFENLRDLILEQARAAQEDKLPVRIRGFNIMDQYIIATQLTIGHHPPIPLYQTGFFDLFTEKLHAMELIPQVYLPD